MAITDHNTDAHHLELPGLSKQFGIGLIPGQEVTTESGHANAFGDIGVIDFRRPAATWVSEVASRGGLLSINHPLGGDCSWRQPLPEHPPLAEVWHSSWLDPALGRTHRLVASLGHESARRRSVAATGTTRPRITPPGTPTTWIAVDAAAEGPDELPPAVLEGLAAGRTAISAVLHRSHPPPHRRRVRCPGRPQHRPHLPRRHPPPHPLRPRGPTRHPRPPLPRSPTKAASPPSAPNPSDATSGRHCGDRRVQGRRAGSSVGCGADWGDD